MTYGEMYEGAVAELGSRFDAGQLFTHVSAKRVFHLSFLKDKACPEKQAELFLTLVDRRRAGEPLQYLLGEWEFYGLPFKVGAGVLIPRQDTETLVDVALEKIREVERPEVLDLCSGSGCVAIALGHVRPDAVVTAVELSDPAFAYLRRNVDINHSMVSAIRKDLWEYTHPRAVDLLVSNPPYIPHEHIASLQAEVRFEPRRALDGGVDGLDFYRAIVRLYQPQLAENGWLCMEVGVGQNGRVKAILEEHGFTGVGDTKDLGGVPRVVFGQNAGRA